MARLVPPDRPGLFSAATLFRKKAWTMNKINKTYIVGIVCILFAVWIIWSTGGISEKLVSGEPGPRLFPYISAAGIIICSILTMIFDGPKDAKREKKPFLTKDGWKRLLIIFAEVAVFAAGMHFLGVLITGSVMTFVFILTLKREKKINYIFAIALSVGLTCLVYFGFTMGFHLLLPKGELWTMLGIQLPF